MLRFNSTTVQLIQEEIRGSPAVQRSFNSTTVQLIQYVANQTAANKITFQFHNGTINTKPDRNLRRKLQKRFNSTTVQLIRNRKSNRARVSDVSIPQRYN